MLYYVNNNHCWLRSSRACREWIALLISCSFNVEWFLSNKRVDTFSSRSSSFSLQLFLCSLRSFCAESIMFNCAIFYRWSETYRVRVFLYNIFLAIYIICSNEHIYIFFKCITYSRKGLYCRSPSNNVHT